MPNDSECVHAFNCSLQNTIGWMGVSGMLVHPFCMFFLNRLGPCLRLTMVVCDPGSLLTEWLKHHLWLNLTKYQQAERIKKKSAQFDCQTLQKNLEESL